MDFNLIHTLQTLLKPLKAKLTQMIARGKINLIDDSQSFQQAQVSFSENDVQNRVERFQNYGFTSVPPKDAECVALFLGGQKGFPLIIAADSRETRLKDLKEGESAVYNSQGSKIHLKSDGEILIDNGASQITLKNGKIAIDNGTHELISVLSDLVQEIATLTTSPVGGPLPNPTPFLALKLKLESFQ